MQDDAAPGSPITIVIADDHPVGRAGLRLLLEAEERIRCSPRRETSRRPSSG